MVLPPTALDVMPQLLMPLHTIRSMIKVSTTPFDGPWFVCSVVLPPTALDVMPKGGGKQEARLCVVLMEQV